MSRRLSRISLALVLLVTSEVWALGLGDIRINSALNEPLRAEIQLLSASPDELDNLTIALASADTFQRYGIDRPHYLTDIQFAIVRSGRADGNYVRLTSPTSMSEPFLTFLVEASWTRGRLLREYTVFLDPPTFAPPATDSVPAVQAPSRSTPSDSGRIERTPPAPPPATAPAPQTTPIPQARQPEYEQAQPEPIADDQPYASAGGGDYLVQRRETLWGIASRVRPDNRLSMNQTMLAIFEANPEAFGGNINILRAGAGLRIPSADEIFQIDRGDALAEAQRQHAAWRGGTVPAPVEDTTTRPSLTLVPPDDDYSPDADLPTQDTSYDDVVAPTAREQEIEARIAELETADVPQQQSLIEIRDNELAALREELARIRGEIYEPPVDDTADDPFADDSDEFADDSEILVDDEAVDDLAADDMTAEDTGQAVDEAEQPPPETIIRTQTRSEPSLVDRALGILNEWWMIIVGVVVIVGLALFWFMRRDGDDEDDPDNWQPLDAGDMGDDLSGTESLRAPSMDESIVVVEQGSTPRVDADASLDVPAPAFDEPAAAEASADATGQFGSLEDTFSSETAINLDQSDPIAEADFHMAYGLYDQAADLINGALSVEPDRADLLTKLCEIYFVWGNRDAFIDAAKRLNSSVGDGESADWDKIVIMGQQIAADDELFAGASAAGATKAVDLSFEAGMDETGSLDMELLGADDAAGGDVVDLGAASGETQALEDDAVDFFVDDDSGTEFSLGDETAESPTVETPDFDLTGEMPESDETAEMPAASPTVETPTIEQQFDVLSGTAELPSLDETGGGLSDTGIEVGDETSEINLDDLGLDVDSLAETELASLDDLDATGEMGILDDTGIRDDAPDESEITGKNPEVDLDATGLQESLGDDDTGINESLSETSFNEALDESLLDATGVTQVLSSDLAVETLTDVDPGLDDDDATMLASGLDDDDSIADEADTLLASLDDDDDDFDFAKTEALPKDVFTGSTNLDETGELPAVASTDVELDLDDLTAALQVSDAGDTVEQRRDDETVEQPRPSMSDDDFAGTVALGADDMDDDLTDARTMTEVGTKLDLARAYVDMGDPGGARSILEEVLDEGDEGQRQQAQQLLDSLPG